MNSFIIAIAFAVLAVASAHPIEDYGYLVKVEHKHIPIKEYHHILPVEHVHPIKLEHFDHKEHIDYYAYPKYKFEYGVKDPHTHDHKSQWEMRDGDVVKGEYTLDEADGTKRVVSYHASDKTGFHAEVKKIGKAIHHH